MIKFDKEKEPKSLEIGTVGSKLNVGFYDLLTI